MVKLASMFPSAVIPAIVVMSQYASIQAASAIDLGDCSNFAVMAGTAASFNGATSTLAVGSVGVSPGTSIGGSYIVSDGAVEANTVNAINCASSMLTAYNTAAGVTSTNSATATDLGGLTLLAGVYTNSAGYFQITAGTLTLNGSATDVWIFQTATTVSTASSTSIVLTGGALASNVFWQVGTTLLTGDSSTFVGTVLAGTSITLGTSSVLNGRALAQAAATCSGGATITSPSAYVAGAGSTSSSPSLAPASIPTVASTAAPSAGSVVTAPTSSVRKPAAVDLGDCETFAVMSKTSVTFGGDTSTIGVGSVGVAPGTSITGSYIVSSGQLETNTDAAAKCAVSMLSAFKIASAMNCTNKATPADLGGLTLASGVYCNSGGVFQITAGTLTLTGSATDVWIFQTATSVSTASSTNIVLTGGALAKNVFWKVGTTLTTGAMSTFAGTVLAGTSVTLGTSSVLNGRVLAQTAMTCAGGAAVTSFVAGPIYTSTAPSNSPSAAAGTSSSASSSTSAAGNLSNSVITAIVVMSFVGVVGLALAVYVGMKHSSNQSPPASAKRAADNNV